MTTILRACGATRLASRHRPGSTTRSNLVRTASIPGTRRLHRLVENVGAADVELSADELTEIESAASKIHVQGGRYNEAGERMTNL